ncbi:MAG: prepilin-type N-terminal cleavage/methylation domain-containing protein [Desulfobacter sp.]|nr:MAG: prepilin-type N-terminal cleavage/methylation domain-containing protein [Desulfobacter sp.]
MIKTMFKKAVKRLHNAKKRSNQSGFTLLELLVVVAIMAAIAGTATIALKDTDARASAAAHVAMMDELNKGIRTYRVIKRNELPNHFDSLMELGATDSTDGVRAGSTATSGDSLLGWDAADAVTAPLTAAAVGIMGDAGLTHMQYIDTSLDADGTDSANTCADVNAMIRSRANAVVAGNIFLGVGGNGCGISTELVDGSEATFWNGGKERLTGQPGDANPFATGEPVYLLTGVGPASTLFDASSLGGMTTVPVYRHVKPDQYNRFIAVWQVGVCNADGTAPSGDSGTLCTYDAADQFELIAIVDGALDTKEEELGEWDGTRNTI